jgi:hypothetical protein
LESGQEYVINAVITIVRLIDNCFSFEMILLIRFNLHAKSINIERN